MGEEAGDEGRDGRVKLLFCSFIVPERPNSFF